MVNSILDGRTLTDEAPSQRVTGFGARLFVTNAWYGSAVVFLTGMSSLIALSVIDKDTGIWREYALWAWSQPLTWLGFLLPLIAGVSAWIASDLVHQDAEVWRQTLSHPNTHVVWNLLPVALSALLVLIPANARIGLLVDSATSKYWESLTYSLATQVVGILIACVFGLLSALIFRSRWAALTAFLVSFVLTSGAIFEHTPFVTTGRSNSSAGVLPNWDYLTCRWVLLCALLLLVLAAFPSKGTTSLRRVRTTRVLSAALSIPALAYAFVPIVGEYDQAVDPTATANVCAIGQDNLQVCVLPEDEWILGHYLGVYEEHRQLFSSHGVEVPAIYRQLTPFQATQYQAGFSLRSPNELQFQVLPKELEKAPIDPYYPMCPEELQRVDSEGSLQHFETMLAASWLVDKHASLSEQKPAPLDNYADPIMVDYLQSIGETAANELLARTVAAGTTCDMETQKTDQEAYATWRDRSQG